MKGRRYVLVPKSEYDSLQLKALAADLPPLPQPSADGTVPALEYSRASLARKIIRHRVEVGLTREELARRARIRLNTLLRAESGRHVPSAATIDKIDRALKQAAKPKRRRRS